MTRCCAAKTRRGCFLAGHACRQVRPRHEFNLRKRASISRIHKKPQGSDAARRQSELARHGFGVVAPKAMSGPWWSRNHIRSSGGRDFLSDQHSRLATITHLSQLAADFRRFRAFAASKWLKCNRVQVRKGLWWRPWSYSGLARVPTPLPEGYRGPTMWYQTACQALMANRCLEIRYDGYCRIVEVHACGQTKEGHQVMRIWQVRGGRPQPGRILRLSGLNGATRTAGIARQYGASDRPGTSNRDG